MKEGYGVMWLEQVGKVAESVYSRSQKAAFGIFPAT